MKMAAAKALASLTKKIIPDSVRRVFPDREFVFGPDYIIPTPFDPRLIFELPVAVAKAAIESGTATHIIEDFDEYRAQLARRMGVSIPAKTEKFSIIEAKL